MRSKVVSRKEGVVTGLIISALGFGGVVFTPIIERLIVRFGGAQVGEPKTFIVLSVIFLVVCTLGGLFLKNPPTSDAPAASSASSAAPLTDGSYAPGQVLRDYRFYLVLISMMLACMGGLMMIGFAKPIAVAKGMASTASCGRFSSSRFGNPLRSSAVGHNLPTVRRRRESHINNTAWGSGALRCLSTAPTYSIYSYRFIGFFYGGFLSNFPSLTADLFGPRHMATNYGMVLLGFGAGAVVSSYIAGYYKNLAAQDISLMFPAFIIASCCAGAGVVLMLLLKVPAKKKQK